MHFFGAEYANVQPHSGAQANAAVFLGLLNPGDAILGFELAHGGHLSHGSPVNFSGKVYDAHFYGVEEVSGIIDMDKVAEIAQKSTSKVDHLWCLSLFQRLGLYKIPTDCR